MGRKAGISSRPTWGEVDRATVGFFCFSKRVEKPPAVADYEGQDTTGAWLHTRSVCTITLRLKEDKAGGAPGDKGKAPPALLRIGPDPSEKEGGEANAEIKETI